MYVQYVQVQYTQNRIRKPHASMHVLNQQKQPSRLHLPCMTQLVSTKTYIDPRNLQR